MGYPPAPLSTDRTDNTDQAGDHPADHNAVNAAVNDVVAELGANPSGAAADLTTRLDALATQVQVTDAVAAHADQTDPHTGYLTQAEADALYDPTAALAVHASEADPHAGYQRESEKGTASGYASLDATARVPAAQVGTVEAAVDDSKVLHGDRVWRVPHFFVGMRSGLWYATLTDDVSTETPSGDTLRCTPLFVPRSLTVDRIGVGVPTAGAAGSLIRLGIYHDIGGYPGALLLDAGTVAGNATGERSIDINQALTPGMWWLASAFQGAPATQPGVYAGGISGFVGLTDIMNLNSEPGAFIQTGVTGALPAQFTTTPQTTTVKIRVAILVA